jgi:hypothetical protein
MSALTAKRTEHVVVEALDPALRGRVSLVSRRAGIEAPAPPRCRFVPFYDDLVYGMIAALLAHLFRLLLQPPRAKGLGGVVWFALTLCPRRVPKAVGFSL